MKVVAFSIADRQNLPYFEMLKNSWQKFHPDIELKLYGEEEIKASGDPFFFYRATPLIGRELLKEYDIVVKIDADSIVTGDLSHTWESSEDYDVAVVQNSNPKEAKTYPVGVWDINPQIYVNCGYVVMKSKTFVEHWWALCSSYHFNNYQFKEQDFLNILVYYCGYRCRLLDSDGEGNKWHGLISKGYWNQIELKYETKDIKGSLPGKKLILPKNDEWPRGMDKEIDIIHWAGGNTPDKMNFRIHFKEDMIKHLDWLTSNEKKA